MNKRIQNKLNKADAAHSKAYRAFVKASKAYERAGYRLDGAIRAYAVELNKGG